VVENNIIISFVSFLSKQALPPLCGGKWVKKFGTDPIAPKYNGETVSER
jgi:hypothetical protein